MKKIITFIMLLTFATNVNSQTNLVPNPSFDIVDSCGNSYMMSGIANNNVPPWMAAGGSPDAYNTCSTSYNWSVPNNQFGFQYAHSGSGYAGGVFYNNPDVREWIEVQLDSALSPGVSYCIGFYVSLSAGYCVGSNNVGLYLSYTQPWTTIGVTPQINYTTVITDTSNWTYIHGNYIAIGGEKFITIGNFYPHSATDTVHMAGSSVGASYFYIDDVDIHRGVCPIIDGVNDLENNLQINIYPNPATSLITISSNRGKIEEIEIYNNVGELIYKTDFTNIQTTIDLGRQPKGIYFVRITDNNQNVTNKKIIIQ